jgi:serine/threonine protein kinase/Ca2+-binding EF-hand superfamily protein
MGNKHSAAGKIHSGAPKLAASKFGDDELFILKQTWADMAERNDGRGIDKDTFLQYFPVNGLLGERMFVSFDTKGTGFIDLDDFVIALAVIGRGNLDQKTRFLFDICDVHKEGTVSKAELETFLNQVPTEILHAHSNPMLSPKHTAEEAAAARSRAASAASPVPGGAAAAAPGEGSSEKTGGEGGCDALGGASTTQTAAGDDASGGGANGEEEEEEGGEEEDDDDLATDSDEEYEEQVDAYTNHDIVVQAFHDCDVEHDGRLTYEEFKMWVERTPVVLRYIESIVPYAGAKDEKKQCHSKMDALPLSYVSSSTKGGGMASSMSRNVSTNGLDQYGYDAEAESLSVKIDTEVTGNDTSTFHKLVRQNSRGRTSVKFQQQNNTNNSSPEAALLGAMASGAAPDNSNINNNNDNMNLDSSMAAAGATNGVSISTSTVTSPAGGQVLSLERQKGVLTDFDLPQRLGSGTASIPEMHADKGNSELIAMMHLEAAMGATQSDDIKTAVKELIEYMSHHHHNEHVKDLTPADVANAELAASTPREDEVVSHQGDLWKRGSHLHLWSKRYYVLSGSCIYYYASSQDIRPKHVIFLAGSVIEKVKDVALETKGYYGFEVTHMNIVSGDHHKHDTRILYTRSEDTRDQWVVALQQAAHVVPITDHYVIATELGRGRFSVVHECVNKKSGEHLAVKIIDKNTVKPEEKALLRTEIAVLKLMHHPHIIRMDGLYETKDKVYIVMEMLKGGELFERIVGRPRFSEEDIAKLLRPLLESVAYMHDLGIVHRDIKPENILCGENLDDVKIADFGLSKMIMPNEKMMQACGTLSYVAPEVLTNKGYGKEADMWSVGVIMFLLMCGKLPFDGDDTTEIIKNIIQGDLKVNSGVWNKLTDEAKSLLTSLLNKSANDRISARGALKHPFLLGFFPEHARRRKSRTASVASHMPSPRKPGLGAENAGKHNHGSTNSNGNHHHNTTTTTTSEAAAAAAASVANAASPPPAPVA